MSPRQAFDIGRMPPGDRGPALRALLVRFSAKLDAAQAGGGAMTASRKAVIARAEWAVRKVHAVAHRYDVDLGVLDMPVASGLTGEQRRALAEALADPVSCAALADACLSRSGLGIAAHA